MRRLLEYGFALIGLIFWLWIPLGLLMVLGDLETKIELLKCERFFQIGLACFVLSLWVRGFERNA